MKFTATFRPATAADADLLAQIGTQSFEEAFGAANTPENMAAFLSNTFTPALLIAELAKPDYQIYLLEVNNEPAGYLKLRWPAPDGRVPYKEVLQICQLYLLRSFLGTGLGDKLMQFSLDKAKNAGCQAVWLTVWEHNPRAISFYQKWGFTQSGTENFVLGDDVQLDYVMVKTL